MPITNRLANPSRRVAVGALFLILLVRLLLQFMLYRAGFESLTADEFGRVVVAAHWAQQPYLNWSGAWLPLHMYALGAVLRLRWDLLAAPRIVTGLWGVAAIVLIYILATTLLRSRRIGLLSALLLAVNPTHLWLSSTPLTEAPYTTLMLGALVCLARYQVKPRHRWLVASGLLLLLANGFRFEGWMFTILWSTGLAWLAWRNWRTTRRYFATAQLLGIAALPWLIPAAWGVGNYVVTGNPLDFLQGIKSYKLLWYGGGHVYRNYLTTFLRIDPYATVLIWLGIGCALHHSSRTRLSWFVGITLLPLGIFVYLHGGQPEPSGNYLRYLAPFLFAVYPLVAWAIERTLRAVIKPPLARAVLLVMVVGTMTITQLHTAFGFTNDSAAMGIAVGQQIRAIRHSHPELAQRPMLVELTFWQYLAVQVGANDIEHLMYDRPLNFTQREAPSFLLLHLPQMRNCIATRNVSYLAVHTPEVRAVVERELGLTAEHVVNQYAFYPVPERLLAAPPEADACSLPATTPGL